jgi:hypothetical protein
MEAEQARQRIGTWSSQACFHTPDTVPTVLQWKKFHAKKSKAQSPANTSRSEEEKKYSTVSPHVAPHQHHPSQSAVTSTHDMPMEVDSSSDGRSDPGKANLFGNTVFDDPSFRARKPTAAEKAFDIHWDEEDHIHKMEVAAKATAIRADVEEQIHHQMSCAPSVKFLPDMDGINEDNNEGGLFPSLHPAETDCQAAQRKQQEKQQVHLSTLTAQLHKAEIKAAAAALHAEALGSLHLPDTPTPSGNSTSADSPTTQSTPTVLHTEVVSKPNVAQPPNVNAHNSTHFHTLKVLGLSTAFASVQQHERSKIFPSSMVVMASSTTTNSFSAVILGHHTRGSFYNKTASSVSIKCVQVFVGPTRCTPCEWRC